MSKMRLALNSMHRRGAAFCFETPLIAACTSGSLEIVRILLQAGASVHIANQKGHTALSEACYHGHSEIVKELVLAGAAIDVRSTFGSTPLHDAAHGSTASHTEICSLLLRNGVDANITDVLNNTPLHSAVEIGNLDTASLLVHFGARPDARNTSNETPIMRAFLNRRWKASSCAH